MRPRGSSARGYWYREFRRPSLFRLTARNLTFRRTEHGENFHCSSAPAQLRSQITPIPVRLRDRRAGRCRRSADRNRHLRGRHAPADRHCGRAARVGNGHRAERTRHPHLRLGKSSQSPASLGGGSGFASRNPVKCWESPRSPVTTPDSPLSRLVSRVLSFRPLMISSAQYGSAAASFADFESCPTPALARSRAELPRKLRGWLWREPDWPSRLTSAS